MDATAEQGTGTGEELNGNGGGEPGEQQGDGERKSLQQLADEEPDATEEGEQYTLFGSAPRLNGSIQGTKVNTSHVKFKARQQDVPGQFGMGEVVELRVLARVDKVEFISKHDGDGNVLATKRIHQLNALSVEQVGDVPGEFAEVDGRMEAMERE